MGQHSVFDTVLPKYSKELSTAVEDEAHRLAIDAAKKRAAAQNADYPTFAALVSVAHLKPLDNQCKRGLGEHQTVRRAPAWSFDPAGQLGASSNVQGNSRGYSRKGVFDCISGIPCCRGCSSCLQHLNKYCIKNPLFQSNQAAGIKNLTEMHCQNSNPTMQNAPGSKNSCPPGKTSICIVSGDQVVHRICCSPLMNSDIFQREWKILETNLQNRLLFLLSIMPHEFPHIFRVEVPPPIIADIIVILNYWKKITPSLFGQSVDNMYPGNLYLNNCHSSPPMDEIADARQECVTKKKPRAVSEYIKNNSPNPRKMYDARQVFCILAALSKCKRFSLSVKLIGHKAQSVAAILFEDIVDFLENDGKHLKLSPDTSPGDYDEAKQIVTSAESIDSNAVRELKFMYVAKRE